MSHTAGKPLVTHLNDSGHLLREDVKQFDLSGNPRAVFSMSKQSKSERKKSRILTGHFNQTIDPEFFYTEKSHLVCSLKAPKTKIELLFKCSRPLRANNHHRCERQSTVTTVHCVSQLVCSKKLHFADDDFGYTVKYQSKNNNKKNKTLTM